MPVKYHTWLDGLFKNSAAVLPWSSRAALRLASSHCYAAARQKVLVEVPFKKDSTRTP